MAGILGNTSDTEGATWANSAPAGTVVDRDYGQQVADANQRGYAITVHNPSTVTALTVRVLSKESFRGTARYAELSTFTVAAGATKQVSVDAIWLASEGGRLALSNNTLLGLTDGFTANLRVRQV